MNPSKIDITEGMMGIEPIVESSVDNGFPFVFFAFLFLLSCVFIFLYKKIKSSEITEQSPNKQIQKNLRKIKSLDLSQADQHQIFISSLIDVLDKFMFQTYKKDFSRLTTEEKSEMIPKLSFLNEKQKIELINIFKKADEIKFASAAWNTKMLQEFYDRVKFMIQELKKDE